MSQISRLHEIEIQNGNLINADDLNDELNSLVNESNAQDTRLTDLESGSITISGAKTFSGNTSFTNPASFTGLITAQNAVNISRSSDPSTPADGTIWYNSSAFQYRFQVGGQTLGFQPGAWPPYYRGTAAPVYASASTFTVSRVMDRTHNNTGNLYSETPVTVDISTNGLNGCAQSIDLAGTIGTGGSPSTTITGTGTAFTTDFIVGDVIWTSGGARRITVITSNTSLTVESSITITNGTAYRRGGEAPNTWYNLYAITNGALTGFLLDTRNAAAGEAVPNLSGLQYRQQPFAVRNDASANIIPFVVGMGWPNRPYIQYRTTFNSWSTAAGPTNVLDAGAATSYTDVSLASFVPPISRLARLKASSVNATNNSSYNVRTNGDSSNGYTYETLVTSQRSVDQTFDMETDSSQVIEYRNVAAAGSTDIVVMGFTVTEVP